jgi:hypothetical protein
LLMHEGINFLQQCLGLQWWVQHAHAVVGSARLRGFWREDACLCSHALCVPFLAGPLGCPQDHCFGVQLVHVECVWLRADARFGAHTCTSHAYGWAVACLSVICHTEASQTDAGFIHRSTGSAALCSPAACCADTQQRCHTDSRVALCSSHTVFAPACDFARAARCPGCCDGAAFCVLWREVCWCLQCWLGAA